MGAELVSPPRHQPGTHEGQSRESTGRYPLRPPDSRVPVETGAAHDGLGWADRLGRLPDGHPSSPRCRPDSRDDRPLTDAEHAEHVLAVEARLAGAVAAGLSTHVQHTIDKRNEVWSYDRRLAHDDIVQALYAKAAAVPCEYRAIVAGGLPGAGKTTVLTEHAGIDLAAYLMINPDLVKVELAVRGLVPRVDGLSPMEAARLAHEESSHLAKRLAHRAHADGRNVIWDVTMSKAETCVRRIGALTAAGYTHVDSVFVHIPVEISLRRADARHRKGHDEYLAGAGLGGRFVPQELILAQCDPGWGSVNRANFEQVKQRFGSWALYDNSGEGRPARLVDHSYPDRKETPE